MEIKIDPQTKTEFLQVKEALKKPLFYVLFVLFSIVGVIFANWPAWQTLPFVFGLCLLTTIDFKHMVLPDLVNLPLLMLGLGLHFLSDGQAVIPFLGLLAGFLIFMLVYYISFKVKGAEAMGFGDVKLMATLGAWVGLMGVPLVLLISTFSALIFVLFKAGYKKYFENTPFPFGPFLCFAGFVTWVWGAPIWSIVLAFRAYFLSFIY